MGVFTLRRSSSADGNSWAFWHQTIQCDLVTLRRGSNGREDTHQTKYRNGLFGDTSESGDSLQSLSDSFDGAIFRLGAARATPTTCESAGYASASVQREQHQRLRRQAAHHPPACVCCWARLGREAAVERNVEYVRAGIRPIRVRVGSEGARQHGFGQPLGARRAVMRWAGWG